MRRRAFKLTVLLLFAALMAALGTPAAVVEAPEARQPAAEQDTRRDGIDTLARLADQERLFRAWPPAEERATGAYGDD